MTTVNPTNRLSSTMRLLLTITLTGAPVALGCGDDIAGSAGNSDSQGESDSTATVGDPRPTSTEGTPTGGHAESAGDSDSNSASGSSGSMTEGDGTTGEVETEECLSQVCTVPNSHLLIQEAVDDKECKVVDVCPGIYQENLIISRSVTLKRAPVLGDEPVVIDGNKKDRVITFMDEVEEDNKSLSVTLKRLTLQNGDSSNLSDKEKGGGGVLAHAFWGNLVIDTCVIQKNNALGYGGGLLAWGLDTLKIINSRILDNTLGESDEFGYLARGGGLHSSSSPSKVEIVDSVISGNQILGEHYNVQVSGGGLSVSGAFLNLKGADVSGNHITVHQNFELMSSDNISQVSANGGGLAIEAMVVGIEQSHFDQNTIEVVMDNDADHEQYVNVEGGGIYGVDGYGVPKDAVPSLKVSGSTFNGNKVLVSGTWVSRGNSGEDWRVMTAGGGGIGLGGLAYGMDVEFSDIEVRGNEVATTAHVIHGNQGGEIRPLILWGGGGGVSMFTFGYLSGKKIEFLRADISKNNVSMIQENAMADIYIVAQGGGVYGIAGVNEGSLDLREVALADNRIEVLDPSDAPWRSRAQGGGLHVVQGPLNSFGWARVFQSTLSGNAIKSSGGAQGGGAAVVSATKSCLDSTQHPTTVMENVTVSRNSVEGGATTSEGGGLWLYGRLPPISNDCSPAMPKDLWQQVELSNVTITDNKAVTGGGVHMAGDASPNSTRTNVRNSLFYGNQATVGPDCFTGGVLHLASLDYNAFQTLEQCKVTGELAHNLVGQDPQVAPLADNGGFTRTQAIKKGSVAATLGRPGACQDHMGQSIQVDQRGYQRPAGARCDIGAFEAEAKP